MPVYGDVFIIYMKLIYRSWVFIMNLFITPLRSIFWVLAMFTPFYSQATGFNFWESSTLNSSLANANGAKARDASVQAMVPASITQLNQPMITASVTHYEVSTDYKIFRDESYYRVSNAIPSGFFSFPINNRWYVGLGIYSRAAADMNVPSIILIHPNETRIQPITVSVAPTIAYKAGNISVAITGEYLVSENNLYVTQCRFNICETENETNHASGVSGALSVTWQVNSDLSIALMHRLATQFGNAEIDFSLPSISSVYVNVELLANLNWDLNYSLSRWEGGGIKFTSYSDVLGLLEGSRDSNRYATGLEYKINDWFLRAGVSIDEAIDMQGGNDKRYRLGVGYHITDNIHLNLAAFKEYYAVKAFSADGVDLVRVQNKGKGLSFGISYQF